MKRAPSQGCPCSHWVFGRLDTTARAGDRRVGGRYAGGDVTRTPAENGTTAPVDGHAPTRRIESGADGWLFSVREAIVDAIDASHSGDPDAVTVYLTAVTEIATNAFESHERVGTDEPVVVTVDPQRAHVTVADLGGGFDPDERPPRPSPDQIRGRGLYLARSFCPDMSWQRNPGGMVCTLPFPFQ